MGVVGKLPAQGIVACLIRLWLITSDYQKIIANRVEVSTPLNSWKRVTEGVHLLNEGVNPYFGDLVHEPPLNLHIYKYIIQWSEKFLPIVFVLCDLLTALLLYKTATKYFNWSLEQQSKMLNENKKYVEKNAKHIQKEGITNSDMLLLKIGDAKLSPTYVFLAYLFHPYIICNCVAMTTTVFSNLFFALFLFAVIHGNVLLSCASLAMATTQSLYAAILICPLVLKFTLTNTSLRKPIFCIAVVVSFVLGLTYISHKLTGDWQFIENTYGFILLVPDLRPNIGLFWYFFTEMFDHFRALFISAFQINVMFLYLIPLSIRFRRDPVILASSLIILTAIFKSYPSLGDVGFCLAILPMWTHLFSYLQQGFLVSCCFLITTVLGPIVWHLWIYSRSANANFYFGVTLSFATAQIFLITDLLFAYIKREFWLKNNHISNTDSKDAKLTLE